MITVSIDPATNQVVMFTLPRDTVDVPLPPGPARSVFGSVYAGKINSFSGRREHAPTPSPGTNATRGYNGLKAVLGNLYGLDIKYYVEVNFDGFRQVVDALGGVTINVQVPVLDDNFPQPNSHRERLFVPAGIQHMTGAQALEYARSRKSTSDFERGARQQRVIVSLRQQLDIGSVLKNINPLAAAIGQSLQTDIPRELVPQLLGLAEKVDTRSIRSVIFTPPFYQTECFNCPPRGYIIQPRVSAHPRRRGGGVQHRSRLRRGARRARRGGRAALGPQRLRPDRRGGAPVRIPELPRHRRVGAEPEAGHDRPHRDDDPRLQRRRGQVPRRRSPT